MCDHQYYNQCTWTNFYQHYLHQHAIMTQWFQQLNQNASTVNPSNPCQSYQNDCYNFRNGCCHPEECYSSTSDSTSSANYTSNASEYEILEKDNHATCEDEDESDCEYELNVDAILAMRAAKEELSKTSRSESESIVLVDSDKEEFEFVELGSLQTLESQLSKNVGNFTNVKEEEKNQKKIMEYLYGEKSATIAGLETAMAVNFERLCDINQPSLWPVLPVRL